MTKSCKFSARASAFRFPMQNCTKRLFIYRPTTAGAHEVDRAVKVEGAQPLRPQVDLGQPCAHRNLPRIAGQIQGWKDLGGFPDFSRWGAPLFVEEGPDGVGAPGG